MSFSYNHTPLPNSRLIVLCSVSRSFQCNGIDRVYLHRITFCNITIVIDHNFVTDIETGHAVLVLHIQRYPIFAIVILNQNGIFIRFFDNACYAWLIADDVIHASVVAANQSKHTNHC